MLATCRSSNGRLPERARTIRVYAIALFICFCLFPQRVVAQVAEIQVYEGEIAAPRTFSATLHANYTPDGRKTPGSSGVIAPDGTLTLGPEIAYAINDWLELGTLAPILSLPRTGGWQFDGAEFRALLTVPNAERRTFFYGMNIAFVVSESKWNPSRYAVELRPILGWRAGKFDLALNPILDSELDGFSRTRLTPATRVAYRFDPRWALALEHYADIGPIKHLSRGGENSEQLFAVLDYYGEAVNAEIGAGFGTSAGSDNLVLKLIVSRELD